MQSPSSPPDQSPPDQSSPDLSPPDPQWTILKILQWTTSYFKSHHIDSPRLTAEILLAHILGIKRIDLYLRFDQPLSQEELGGFKALIKRRLNREPVAFIIGSKEFWGIDFDVTQDVLVPRPETEFLVEAALKQIPDALMSSSQRIVDIGTGSGAIIVSLAVNRPGHYFFASDISEKAIKIAVKNAEKNGVKDNISFFVAELFSSLQENSEKFDLILSNPPYIAGSQIAELEPEVSKFEPLTALDGGVDGLDIIRNILQTAPVYLRQKGILMLEIGYDQRAAVEQMGIKSGHYSNVEFIQDYAGHDRVVVMRKS